MSAINPRDNLVCKEWWKKGLTKRMLHCCIAETNCRVGSRAVFKCTP